MKLFARLFGRSRRSGAQPGAGQPDPTGVPPARGPVDPAASSGAASTGGHVAVDQAGDPRISFGQPSTTGRESGGLDEATGQFAFTMPESTMAACPNCGNSNPQGARFCSNCGTPLRRDAERASEQTSTLSISGIEALEGEPQPREVLTPEAQAAVEALPPGTALLVVRRGPNSGSRFLLDAERTTAGRHPESDIFLDDVTVSRRHAEFRRKPNGGFAVADVGSLNGTYVGRQRIDEVPLGPGDEVQIGKYRLVFFPSRHGQQAGGETG